MECELLRSPMISYRSLLYNTTVLYDKWVCRMGGEVFKRRPVHSVVVIITA